MKLNKLPILAFSLLLLLPCCSNPKADYDSVQKIQDASTQSIALTSDYDIKIKSCDDAINSLQTFISNHKEGEWSQTARTALTAWQGKKSSLQQEISSLSETLYNLMSGRATDAAEKHHLLSKIEKLQLADRNTTKEPDKILVNDTYLVKMRGIALGVQVFNFTVKVSGHISTNSKSVIVDNAIIEE